MDFGGSPVERYPTNLGQSKSYAYDLFGGRFSTNPYSAYKRETAIYKIIIVSKSVPDGITNFAKLVPFNLRYLKIIDMYRISIKSLECTRSSSLQ